MQDFVAKRRTLNVSVDEKKYVVKYPTSGRLAEYRKELLADKVDGNELLQGLVAGLGLPADAWQSLEAADQKMLIEILTDQKKD